MVYTKHFVIHTFDTLNKSEEYIRNAAKTVVGKSDSGHHLDSLFKYVASDDKTMLKQLVSSHGIIDIDNAYEEFKYTKLKEACRRGTDYTFNEKTKKMEPPTLKQLEKNNAVLAHHLIQSFSPEDALTPEQIHEIGRQTILELTGGEYEFIIATHVDKDHLHNHIVFNSTNLVTGKAFRWQRGTKRVYEQISDKVASKAGAKIIEKSPKNSHTKYTKWQTESLYKNKIQSRLDFLVAHSSSIDDFCLKAEALNLDVDFSGKWSTFRLLDEPQLKNTRGRSLLKSDPERYNLNKIKEKIKSNVGYFSVGDVKARYEETTALKENNFDFQLTLEDWQLSHKTSKGYYINVDFGSNNRGQVFVGGYKVDSLETGDLNIYIKANESFYFMNEKKSEHSRYITGASLIKQLRLYNGQVPLKKEPIMSSIDELVTAINFLADNDVTDGKQLTQLELKLEEAFSEAEETLEKLDTKIIELHQVEKILFELETGASKEFITKTIEKILPHVTLSEVTLEDIQAEVASIKLSRNFLHDKLELTTKEINRIHNIQAMSEQKKETPTKPRL